MAGYAVKALDSQTWPAFADLVARHCFFVDRSYRHKGVAAAALKGALREIARLGGGTVESSPEDVEGRKVSNSFLYNATVAMFEEQGFTRTRQLGKNNWLVTKRVRAARAPRAGSPADARRPERDPTGGRHAGRVRG